MHWLSMLLALACGVYYAVLGVNLVAAPNRGLARMLNGSMKPLAPFAITYALLLVLSTRGDTAQLLFPGNLQTGLSGFKPQFFPTIASFGTVMARAALSVWLHLMCLNLVVARTIWGERSLFGGVPVRHSIAAAVLVAPVGILMHEITKKVILEMRKVRGEAAKKYNLDGGTLMVLPKRE